MALGRQLLGTTLDLLQKASDKPINENVDKVCGQRTCLPVRIVGASSVRI